MTEQSKCPSCDSTELELRTDYRMMCSKCGYVFPEPEANPNDETPIMVMPIIDPSEADTLVMSEDEIKEVGADDEGDDAE